MKYACIFLCASIALAGCHKNDVDVSTLNTNPFDADHQGDEVFFTIDSVRTVPYNGGGALLDQKIYLRVYPERFPAPSSYSLTCVQTSPATTETMTLSSLGSPNTFVFRNFNVISGTEYCYQVGLHVGTDFAASDDACAVAQL